MPYMNDQPVSRKPRTPRFTDFVDRFPEVELPVTLTAESHHTISKENQPLPEAFTQAFLHELDPRTAGEYAETIACFRLPNTEQDEYYALVYWVANLMDYKYVLATFSKTGELLDRSDIGGTTVQGDRLEQTAVTLEDDGFIYKVRGKAALDSDALDKDGTEIENWELQSTGAIVRL